MMLAAVALVDPQGRAKPVAAWPRKVSFRMEYESGIEQGGVSDDNLAYYGSVIHSQITVEANLIANTRCYELNFASWRAWVADNYDWEGDKQFGGALVSGILPSQSEMPCAHRRTPSP